MSDEKRGGTTMGRAAVSIAGAFALAAFSVATLAGLAGGNDAAAVLQRALMAMIACYPVGLIVGIVAQRVIQDEVEKHRSANPSPDSSGDGRGGGISDDAAEEEEVIVV
jgi:hypothetical protein